MQSYLEKLIGWLAPNGDVLEIGFGPASDLIQAQKPKSHTLISTDPKAKEWADKCGATVIALPLDEAMAQLETYNTIFYSVENDPSQALLEAEELKKTVQKKVPGLYNIKYKNADIEMLIKHVGYLDARFLFELRQNGQITEEQYHYFLDKYDTEEFHPKLTDPLLAAFADTKSFLKAGGRFSGYTLHPVSKYESPQFFSQVITNSDYKYTETMIDITPTKNYPFDKAVGMSIEANA